MDRSTGYAAAVRRAVQHKAASAPVPGGPSGRGRADQVEWLWLLHDDCEPAADALEQLLRGAAETPTAAVLGPKLMDWTDRDVIVEAGLTIDTAGPPRHRRRAAVRSTRASTTATGTRSPCAAPACSSAVTCGSRLAASTLA